MHMLFSGLTSHECETIQITAATPVIQTRAIRLCDLQGTVQRSKRYAHISSPFGQRAKLIVRVPDREYQPWQDELFILGGCDYPVNLGKKPVSRGYTLVTACALWFGACPTRRLLVPWITSNTHYTMSPLSPEEKGLMREFYQRMEQAIHESPADYTPPVFSTIRDRVLGFSVIWLSPLARHEQQLREQRRTH